jgi:hypothetical protein
MTNTIVEKANDILEKLSQDKVLAKYIDTTYPIPRNYVGEGQIKLIVLGQDPTIKDVSKRGNIETALNLDTNGSVHGYLAGVCQKMDIDLKQNVYATNLYKNFFITPPTQIRELDIFKEFLNPWLELLKDELAQYKAIPVITLGEPILFRLELFNPLKHLREYWGYTPDWKIGLLGPLQHLRPIDNLLGRTIFPFPHQPSLRKEFYKMRMDEYIEYMRVNAYS